VELHGENRPKKSPCLFFLFLINILVKKLITKIKIKKIKIFIIIDMALNRKKRFLPINMNIQQKN